MTKNVQRVEKFIVDITKKIGELAITKENYKKFSQLRYDVYCILVSEEETLEKNKDLLRKLTTIKKSLIEITGKLYTSRYANKRIRGADDDFDGGSDGGGVGFML